MYVGSTWGKVESCECGGAAPDLRKVAFGAERKGGREGRRKGMEGRKGGREGKGMQRIRKKAKEGDWKTKIHPPL